MNAAYKTEKVEDVDGMQYEHESMEPAEDAPAARVLLENECGSSGLFVLMVDGISHSYVRVDNIFNEQYEEISVHGPPCDPALWG